MLTPCLPRTWASTYPGATPTQAPMGTALSCFVGQQAGTFGVPVSSPTKELSPRSKGTRQIPSTLPRPWAPHWPHEAPWPRPKLEGVPNAGQAAGCPLHLPGGPGGPRGPGTPASTVSTAAEAGCESPSAGRARPPVTLWGRPGVLGLSSPRAETGTPDSTGPQSSPRKPSVCYCSRQSPGQRAEKAQRASIIHKLLPEHSRPVRVWPCPTHLSTAPGQNTLLHPRPTPHSTPQALS